MYAPPSLYFLSRTKQLCVRRNRLKDNQLHCKHLGHQPFSTTLAAMTSVNLYRCCSVPPSVFYNSEAETVLHTACCVQYRMSVVTATIEVLHSPKQCVWNLGRHFSVCVCVNANCSDLWGFFYLHENRQLREVERFWQIYKDIYLKRQVPHGIYNILIVQFITSEIDIFLSPD